MFELHLILKPYLKALAAVLLVGLAACSQRPEQFRLDLLRSSVLNRGPIPTSIPIDTPSPTPVQNPVSAPPSSPTPNSSTCMSRDPEQLCIGIKWVSFLDGGKVPVATRADTLTLMQEINALWKDCKISFQLETFLSIDPAQASLDYQLDWLNDGDRTRMLFEDNQKFLVVAVGPWSNSTLAVTKLPGNGPHGIIVEKNHALNPITLGHELGHYQGLRHFKDDENLMNPHIGPRTLTLSREQCEYARESIFSYWQKMLRSP